MDDTELKIHYVNQGRADNLVALAQLFSWSRGKAIGIGRKVGVSASDIGAAFERAAAYSEVGA